MINYLKFNNSIKLLCINKNLNYFDINKNSNISKIPSLVKKVDKHQSKKLLINKYYNYKNKNSNLNLNLNKFCSKINNHILPKNNAYKFKTEFNNIKLNNYNKLLFNTTFLSNKHYWKGVKFIEAREKKLNILRKLKERVKIVKSKSVSNLINYKKINLNKYQSCNSTEFLNTYKYFKHIKIDEIKNKIAYNECSFKPVINEKYFFIYIIYLLIFKAKFAK